MVVDEHRAAIERQRERADRRLLEPHAAERLDRMDEAIGDPGERGAHGGIGGAGVRSAAAERRRADV